MRLNPEKFEGSAMTITEYPNPILRRRGADIVDFDEKLKQTCKEMMTIMYQANGVGLAAPQVNLGLRLFVYNPSGDKKLKMLEKVVCNPTILEYSTESDIEDEGCLSSRSDCCDGAVCRAKWLWVEYQDVEGRKTKKKLTGFEARVFQHEYDHIDGVLHLDRFADDDRARIQPELDAMVAEYGGEEMILELPAEKKATLEPPPLSGRMPSILDDGDAVAIAPPKKKKAPPPPKTGFGGMGAATTKAKATKAKPKKKKR